MDTIVTRILLAPITTDHLRALARTGTVETEHTVRTSTNVLPMDTIVTLMLLALITMDHFRVPVTLDSVAAEHHVMTLTSVTTPPHVIQMLHVTIPSAHLVAAVMMVTLEMGQNA